MAVGKFDKEEVSETTMAITEMFAALSEEKRREFVDHYVNTMLFMFAAHTAAPEESNDD